MILFACPLEVQKSSVFPMVCMSRYNGADTNKIVVISSTKLSYMQVITKLKLCLW